VADRKRGRKKKRKGNLIVSLCVEKRPFVNYKREKRKGYGAALCRSQRWGRQCRGKKGKETIPRKGCASNRRRGRAFCKKDRKKKEKLFLKRKKKTSVLERRGATGNKHGGCAGRGLNSLQEKFQTKAVGEKERGGPPAWLCRAEGEGFMAERESFSPRGGENGIIHAVVTKVCDHAGKGRNEIEKKKRCYSNKKEKRKGVGAKRGGEKGARVRVRKIAE